MYPLDFPLAALRRRKPSDRWVLDPFCGRGTTSLASRLLGLGSVGIDSSPVAAAIARAKIAWSTPGRVLLTARNILRAQREPSCVPHGAFWAQAYDKHTLRDICILREMLLESCESDSRIILRAILLGALHGPVCVGEPSYLSNQAPRTFAPKPRYALKFWKERGLHPPRVDVLSVIARRASRYLIGLLKPPRSSILLADSRLPSSFVSMPKFDWVITSPPYYGMRTYIPDQWLRNWFLGGEEAVEYRAPEQVSHASRDAFVGDLRDVWTNAARVAKPNAQLVCRFGGIRDRNAEPLEIIRESFHDSGWRLRTARSAGNARDGRRQADHFLNVPTAPRAEYDLYAARR